MFQWDQNPGKEEGAITMFWLHFQGPLMLSSIIDTPWHRYSLPGLVPVAVGGTLLTLSIFSFREARNVSVWTILKKIIRGLSHF